MKIFHCVESYYPSVGGMQEVVKQLSERLAGFGHEVTVLTRHHPERNFEVLNGVKVVSFNIEGNPTTVNTAEEQRYVNYLLGMQADVVSFFAAQQWATDLALPVLKQIKAKKVSVPTGYSGFYKPEYKTYFENMKSYIHDYDMNVYLSYDYRDINFARQQGVNKIIVIPNGAAADEFLPETTIDVRKELKIPEDHFLILLVGSYTGIKGHKEAAEIFWRSGLKKATLLMIGNKYGYFKRQYVKRPWLGLLWLFSKLTGKRMIFGFFSRPFTVAAYKQADLFLFPSNIECSPIVLFESAAAKLPFLASDVGNSVEINQWTGGGEIIPTEKDKDGYSHVKIGKGIKMLKALYQDKGKRDRMAETAFRNWEQKFSWEVIAREYEKLYKDLSGCA